MLRANCTDGGFLPTVQHGWALRQEVVSGQMCSRNTVCGMVSRRDSTAPYGLFATNQLKTASPFSYAFDSRALPVRAAQKEGQRLFRNSRICSWKIHQFRLLFAGPEPSP